MGGRLAWIMAGGALLVGLAGCTGESAPQAHAQVDHRALLTAVSQRHACTRMDMSAAMTACRDDMQVVRDTMDQLKPTLPHDPAGRLFNTASSARLRAQQYLDAGCGRGDTVIASLECSMWSRDATIHMQNLLTWWR